MGFSSRRGRPKREAVQEVDRGTMQLQQKRRAALTVEPLDWLREEGVINAQQHWCGLHFRWLYTLRYGAFTPQSLDAAREKGILHKREYEEWQGEREGEWREVTQQLKQAGLLEMALEFCVYSQVIPTQWRQFRHRSGPRRQKLCESLREMQLMWCKQSTI